MEWFIAYFKQCCGVWCFQIIIDNCKYRSYWSNIYLCMIYPISSRIQHLCIRIFYVFTCDMHYYFYIYYKVWYEITYPFPNFNGYTVEVGEWIINFILHFTWHTFTHSCWEYSLSMLVKGALVDSDHPSHISTVLFVSTCDLQSSRPIPTWAQILRWNNHHAHVLYFAVFDVLCLIAFVKLI